MFRPFPYLEIADALKHLKAIAVLDRADSFGGYGPLFMEIASAVMSMNTKPAMTNKIFGLGGRDYLPDQAEQVLDELIKVAKNRKSPNRKRVYRSKRIKTGLGSGIRIIKT
jgi:pyruvate ferredoxin oxidoreductase alpha subunit